jgi:6-pyruvoyl-tetrahydropterin synthase
MTPEIDLVWAGWHFSASHHDQIRNETHGHSYEVMVGWPAMPPRDALVLQAKLKVVLSSFDHKTLPREMSRAEQIAHAIIGLLGDCTVVEISRPVERLKVTVWA